MASLQFKRGLAANWGKYTGILLVGEPGFETDTGKLKIGNGVDKWVDLPYVGESSVVNADTHYDFPSVGKVDVIYKAESERLLYQWNTTDLKYEVICEAEISGDLADIKIINGGGAAEE